MNKKRWSYSVVILGCSLFLLTGCQSDKKELEAKTAELNQVKAELAGVQQEQEGLTQKIEQLTEDLTQKAAEIATLQGEKGSLESELAATQRKLQQLGKRAEVQNHQFDLLSKRAKDDRARLKVIKGKYEELLQQSKVVDTQPATPNGALAVLDAMTAISF